MTGEIHLVGATTRMYREDGSGATTYFDGPISGTSALLISGGDGNGTTIHFRNPTNSYAGGTYVKCTSYGQGDRSRVYAGTSFGTGTIWIDGTSSYNPIQLAESVTWANALRGVGRINTLQSGSSYHTLTVTGSLAPFDTGYGVEPDSKVAGQGTASIGFVIDKLQFATDTKGATYHWQYDGEESDLVQAPRGLTFGSATKTVEIEWLGEGDAELGSYPLFTFGGDAPAIDAGTWQVNAPKGLAGSLSVEGDTVMLNLVSGRPAGTVLILR